MKLQITMLDGTVHYLPLVEIDSMALVDVGYAIQRYQGSEYPIRYGLEETPTTDQTIATPVPNVVQGTVEPIPIPNATVHVPEPIPVPNVTVEEPPIINATVPEPIPMVEETVISQSQGVDAIIPDATPQSFETNGIAEANTTDIPDNVPKKEIVSKDACNDVVDALLWTRKTPVTTIRPSVNINNTPITPLTPNAQMTEI